MIASCHARIALVILMALGSLSCRPEDSLIFQPSRDIVGTPRDVGLDYQDHDFTTADGMRLNGWYIPCRDAQMTLVWFHGNAGNISHRVENIKLLHDLVKINVFIFDYRGYGKSDGRPSEAGTYRDGAAAMEFVKKQFNVEAKHLILFGRSLGAAVATEMAQRYDSRAIILESPFASIRAMAEAIFPSLPLATLLRTDYDNLAKVRNIRVPLLVLHGDRDEIIPFEQGKQVFAAANEPKEFFTIRGAGHNDTIFVGGAAYFAKLKSFIENPPRAGS